MYKTNGDTRLDRFRSGAGTEQGYTWRSSILVTVGVGISAMAALVGSIYWFQPVEKSEALGDALFSGPIAAALFWMGAAFIRSHATVNIEGITVRNIFRRGFIPWGDLTSARVGLFGLVVETNSFKLPVFVWQSTNISYAMQEDQRPMNKLSRELLALRDSASPRIASSYPPAKHLIRIGILELALVGYSAIAIIGILSRST